MAVLRPGSKDCAPFRRDHAPRAGRRLAWHPQGAKDFIATGVAKKSGMLH
jgi:hypothetical protein